MKIKQKLIRILGGVTRDEYDKHERARMETLRQLEELERDFGKLGERYNKVCDELDQVKPPCKIGDEVYVIRDYKGVWKPKEGIVSEIYYLPDMSLQIVCKGVGRGKWREKVFEYAWHAEIKCIELNGDGDFFY